MSHRPERISAYVQLIVAPNPGPMTLDGTNTWIIGDPAAAAPVVVDPGPLAEAHLATILAACGDRVAAVVLTHRHHDHSAAAAELAERGGCGVRAADPAFQRGPNGLVDSDVIRVGGAELGVYATPGHTSDSVSLVVTGEDGVTRLLTGDMVLGRGTTVITHPDGDLAAYFRSLAVLESVVVEQAILEICPGHGPRVHRPAEWLGYYRRHRVERLDQVRAALDAGDRTATEVAERVYGDVDPALRPAAEQSVRAQLRYLATC